VPQLSVWSVTVPRVTAAPALADAELLARAAGGDEPAVGLLFDRHARSMYAVAYRILRDPADADEVVVDAFTQAWREAARFDPRRGSVAAWLTVIARSRALDAARARARRTRLAEGAAREDADAVPGMGRAAAHTDAVADARERQARVAEALAHLAPAQRTAIELAFFEGLSHSEIAERLGEPLGTVKSRVRQGMLRLRDQLRPFFFERTG
jgi:RNA polymerase sigma-70 factor (ECF subfamily)